MEEVPASPEGVKPRKSRRLTGEVQRKTRLSLNREKARGNQQNCVEPNSALLNTPSVPEAKERVSCSEQSRDANLFYLDDNTEPVVFADEDPLVFAAILEKANQIELENSIKPSREFLANVKNKFVKIDDVIEPADNSVERNHQKTNEATLKKANYSYTQFDLDTQMIGICEAADILADLKVAQEHDLKDWSSPMKLENSPSAVNTSVKLEHPSDGEPEQSELICHSPMLTRRKDRWSNVRQSSLYKNKPDDILQCGTLEIAPDAKVTRNFDFSDESDDDLRIDFSKIRSTKLRQRLSKIQSYIDSPPQVVNKTSTRRTFSGKKFLNTLSETPHVIRRLSYEQDEILVPKVDQDPSSDDEMESLDGLQPDLAAVIASQNSVSPQREDFDSSLLIKANIEELSQFFKKSTESHDKKELDSESLEQEPPFYGFCPEPFSPISLASSGSPRTLNIAWLFHNESEPSSVDEDMNTEVQKQENLLDQLLDDDDDFLVQLQSSPNKNCEVEPERDICCIEKMMREKHSLTSTADTSSNEPNRGLNIGYKYDQFVNPTTFGGFQTAGGSGIKVSEKAMAKAQTIWSEEVGMFTEDKVWMKAVEQETCALVDPFVPSSSGSNTAAGSTISESKRVLAKDSENLVETHGDRFTGVGFRTARGNSVQVTEDALAKAHYRFQQLDKEEETYECSTITKTNEEKEKIRSAKQTNVGFQTARGTSIAITESALNKAHMMFRQMEQDFSGEHEMLEAKTNKPYDTMLSGFQTANGKSVKVSESALAKARTIFQQIEEESVNVTSGKTNLTADCSTNIEDQRSKRLRENESLDASGTPLKRRKPNGRLELEMANRTSTPNLSSKGVPNFHPVEDEMEHFFKEMNDQEFHNLFASEEPIPRSSRPLKQVRLVNRFEECDVQSPPTANQSSGNPWDDSFGEVYAKLGIELIDGLKVARQILDARKLARQRQLEYAQNKSDSGRKPRLYEFIRKKKLRDRNTVEQFVGNLKPSQYDGDLPERIGLLDADNVSGFKFDTISLYGKSKCIENVDGIPLDLGDPDATVQLLLDDHCLVGLSELSSAFLATPGVDPNLIPRGWIENAWKWILIKLSSMERNFHGTFRGITTPENVFCQMLYRYHVEIDCAKRPVIRKILEKDEIPNKRMVLFVSRVFRDLDSLDLELELCDGWYAIRTVIDSPLTQAILNGKIKVGTKLMIQGAEIINLNEGVFPLEAPIDVRLKIHANSTRRARWSTKLGLYKVPSNFLISGNSILDQGGLIVCLQLVVVRMYPLMYMDKSKGSTVLRSERFELRRAQVSDANRIENFQTLFSQVQKEFDAERKQASGNGLKKLPPKSLCSAELPELLDAGVDFSCLEVNFTETQRDIIVAHQRRRQEEDMNEINRRVRERMSSQTTTRKSSPFLVVRVMDARKPEKVLLFSIRRPPEDILEIMQEGNALEVTNATANGFRNGEIQLNDSKNCSYRVLNRQLYHLPVSHCRTLTKIAQIDVSSFRPPFNEFDTIGIVVQIGAAEANKFQPVYLADTAMNLLCVNFWSGIKEYAYEDVIKERIVLCISNLQWRPKNAMNELPVSYATERTTFSEHSKNRLFADELTKFHTALETMELEMFYDECCAKVAHFADRKFPRGSSLNTPYRGADIANTSNASTPMRSLHNSLNFIAKTPADFSPDVGQPISAQKRKIQLLAATYKSPPKLTPIVMRSSTRARRNFKIPAKLEDRIAQSRGDDMIS
ncbi:breast cancer type 2 susceptibility protein-like [Malaya genurostris]|uniref:breast cancer type 2 susceptibility protein-like n=1 Tax=Malaya genurostris TaxID=325434 RepID=UPI0026F3D43E|nr:breast cancer type 2 susceptibility protein-like [Malaya genurostris]